MQLSNPKSSLTAANIAPMQPCDLAGSMRLNYPPNVKVIQVPCTGRVDIVHLLRAIEAGADAVYVAG